MKTSDIVIRTGVEADAERLGALAHETFVETYGASSPAEALQAYAESTFTPAAMRAAMEDAGIAFLLAEIDGALAGYASLRQGAPPEGLRGQRPVEIERLYVRSEYHGRGAGAALMEELLARASVDGHDSTWLGVWERNGQAIAFYRRWGFEFRGTQSFGMGGELHTDLVMEKLLDDLAIVD